MTFGSVLTAMITPFDSEGEINYPLAEKLAVHLVENGTDTLVLGSLAGEGPSLSWDELFELTRVVGQAVAGQAKVIAETGASSTREAIEASRKAASLGVDGLLQVCPYYNKPSQEGLLRHFQEIANATELPLLLYNFPNRTAVNLAPETVAKLALNENVVGLVEASGSVDQASAIRILCPALQLFSGEDSMALPFLALGATGVMSIASHLLGSTVAKLVQTFKAGDLEGAVLAHEQLFALSRGLQLDTPPILVKAAMALVGWGDMNYLRLPLTPSADAVQQKLFSLLRQMRMVI